VAVRGTGSPPSKPYGMLVMTIVGWNFIRSFADRKHPDAGSSAMSGREKAAGLGEGRDGESVKYSKGV
jgi:hypothetical protein